MLSAAESRHVYAATLPNAKAVHRFPTFASALRFGASCLESANENRCEFTIK
jgi:hypothetical protein